MQDEVVERVVVLCIQGEKISEKILKEAIRETLAAMERQGRRKEAGKKQGKGRAVYRGKQSMKKLKRQGCDLSSIEITDGNIIFFKASDADAMTAAFKEYSGHQLKGEKRESVQEKLSQAKENIQENVKENEKDRELEKKKHKTREQSL